MLYRSGVPFHLNGTCASGSLQEWPIRGGKTLQIDFQNTHATIDIELFLTKEAADKGAGYGFIVPARAGYTFEVEVVSFYTLVATSGATFTSICACRP